MTVDLNQNNFTSETAGPVTVVDFWAPWCGPCKIVAPIMKELEKEYDGKIKFMKLNVDDNQDIAKKYRVMSIPTLVLFRNGKGVEKVTGVYPKSKLEHYLDRKLAEKWLKWAIN